MRALRWALIVGLTLAVGAAGAMAEELSVIANGEYRDAVNAYKVGSSYYLNAKEAGQLYGG